MRIAWLHNNAYPAYIGGAELTDFFWIKKAKKLDLDIVEVTHSAEIPEVDSYVCANIGKFDHTTLTKRLENKPYVCIVHGGKITRDQIDSTTKDLFNKARLLVCMSPKQERRLKKVIKTNNTISFPPYIDPSLFFNYNKKRIPNSYLFVGAIREHKGIRKILQVAKKSPQNNYHFYGPTKEREIYLVDLIKKQANCIYHGTARNSDLPDIMNKYETFIWYLDPKYSDFESFGRTLAEAILCGMKLEVDKKNFGIFSWNWDYSSPDEISKNIKKYYEDFWPKILTYLS